MDEVQKDILCVLLRTLLDRGLIPGDVYGRAREKVLGTFDLPPFSGTRRMLMDVRKIRTELRRGRSFYDLPLRVTFYARVSTDQDEQVNSLENQVQYYTELIQNKPNWKFVPGYVDEGISGGSTKKRDNFNRMIRDARAGMFDFIITKEISRFPDRPWTASNIPRSCWITMWGCFSERQYQHPGHGQRVPAGDHGGGCPG